MAPLSQRSKGSTASSSERTLKSESEAVKSPAAEAVRMAADAATQRLRASAPLERNVMSVDDYYFSYC